MDIEDTLAELAATVETERRTLVETSRAIWNHPEIALAEYDSSRALVDLLRKYGFTVEYPYAGMETAFRAEFTNKAPGATFALAAEYDALAGLGHGCGHNLSGVASVAAACAAKKSLSPIVFLPSATVSVPSVLPSVSTTVMVWSKPVAPSASL